MTSRKPSDEVTRTRELRLAEALRANLRRRKAASRVRRQDDGEGGSAPKPEQSPDKSGPSGGGP